MSLLSMLKRTGWGHTNSPRPTNECGCVCVFSRNRKGGAVDRFRAVWRSGRSITKMTAARRAPIGCRIRHAPCRVPTHGYRVTLGGPHSRKGKPLSTDGYGDAGLAGASCGRGACALQWRTWHSVARLLARWCCCH